jgi:hypothetical protein
MTTAKPLTRYGAMEWRASRAASLPSSYTITRDNSTHPTLRLELDLPLRFSSTWN